MFEAALLMVSNYTKAPAEFFRCGETLNQIHCPCGIFCVILDVVSIDVALQTANVKMFLLKGQNCWWPLEKQLDLADWFSDTNQCQAG